MPFGCELAQLSEQNRDSCPVSGSGGPPMCIGWAKLAQMAAVARAFVQSNGMSSNDYFFLRSYVDLDRRVLQFHYDLISIIVISNNNYFHCIMRISVFHVL